MKPGPKSRTSLESTLGSVSAADLASVRANTPKDTSVVFRVSTAEKLEMKRTAKKFQLKLSDYLIRLHRLVVRKKG
jgi:hypothetical protein